jgi:hypothetical protein
MLQVRGGTPLRSVVKHRELPPQRVRPSKMEASSKDVCGGTEIFARRALPVGLGILACVILALCVILVFVFRKAPGSTVSYKGRPLQSWFNDFHKVRGNITSDVYPKATIPFVEMGDEAIPFLVHRCTWGRTPLDRAYERVHQWLPQTFRAKLPRPRPELRPTALQLLGAVGSVQKRNIWEGKPTSKCFEQTAIPAIRRALDDPGLRSWACQAIEQSGAAARQAVPDLVGIASADYANKTINDQVLRALGAIGSAASNAVPLLSAIAADPAVKRRGIAVQVLGEIGPPARSAAPVIGALLTGEATPMAWDMVSALAHTGETPEAVLPVLRETLTRGKPLAQMMAAVALWNHDRADPNLQGNIHGLLRAATGEQVKGGIAAGASEAIFLCGPLLEVLGTLGTNAAVFAPSMRRLADSGVLRGHAEHALRQVEGRSQAQ